MLYLKCEGQVVKIVEDERLADKYINANTVHFEFCERWDGMVITAQFTQKRIVLNPETQKQEEETNTFNVLVDEITNTVTMPNEIEAGKVDISVFGVHPETGVRITTIPVTKTVDKSGFVGDGETPIPPTPDLYAQLIAKIDDAEGNQAEQIQNAVDQYLDENPVQTGATQEQAEQIEANKQAIEKNRQAIENYTPPVTSVNGMTGDVVIETGGAADSIEWNNVTDKPITFPPDPHTHSYNELANKPEIPVVPNFLPNPYALTINGKSYNGSEPVNVTVSGGGGAADSVAWEAVTGKPSAYPPEAHTHSLSSLGALGKDETAVNAAKLNGKSADEFVEADLEQAEDAGDIMQTNADLLAGKSLAQIMLMMYPVGAIYTSTVATSPDTLFGGTWESIGGSFLLSADATYPAGSTGGEAAHKLTIEEMPPHKHSGIRRRETDNLLSGGSIAAKGTAENSSYNTDETGGNQPHNNMPPYLAVYMWKRTA